MTDEKGVEAGGDIANSEVATKEQNNGGDIANIDKILNEERKASAGKDKKIAELQAQLNRIEEEKKAKELASKSAEEKVELLANELKSIKSENEFIRAFKSVGLNPDKYTYLKGVKNPKEVAENLAREQQELVSTSKETAITGFKQEQLGKLAQAPQMSNEKKSIEAMLSSKGLI